MMGSAVKMLLKAYPTIFYWVLAVFLPRLSGKNVEVGLGRKLSEESAPILRAMPDVQDLDDFLSNAVYDHVRRTNKFAGSSDFT
jgi:hypothetical protein